MYFGTCIKVNGALLAAFSEYNALSVFKINVIYVKTHQLSDTHSCRSQQVNHRQISQTTALIAHCFKRFVCVGFFDCLAGSYFVDPADGAFDDIIFILQPSKKAGKYASDVVYVTFAAP